MRLALLALVLAACGTSNDDRPLTIEYVTAGVLAPTCGAAQCHSTFAANDLDIFDTVVGARSSIVRNGLVRLDSLPQYDPANPGKSALIIWITQTDPFGLGIGRMPWDAPMPNADIAYLERWIAAGAPGAQCDPGANGKRACNNKDLVQCNDDWSFGAKIMTCPNNCIGGACQ